MTVDEIKELILSIAYATPFAGGIGALISVLWNKPTWNIIFFHVLAGTFGAWYGADPIAEWQGLSGSMRPMLALLIGAFAGSFFGAVFDFVKSGKLSDLFHDFISHLYKRRHSGGDK